MAVYTDVSDEELAFLSAYEIGELFSMNGIAEGAERVRDRRVPRPPPRTCACVSRRRSALVREKALSLTC